MRAANGVPGLDSIMSICGKHKLPIVAVPVPTREQTAQQPVAVDVVQRVLRQAVEVVRGAQMRSVAEHRALEAEKGKGGLHQTAAEVKFSAACVRGGSADQPRLMGLEEIAGTGLDLTFLS